MTATGDEIAIVGIGCNFPGGEGIENFWQVLVEGRNCTVEITPERFNTTEWYDPDDTKPGKICTTRAALIDGFNTFDNKLFGINDMEAERMDPQQKLLLECTYRALEDAGVTMERVSGSKTGVFVGLMNRDYEIITSRAVTEINHYDGTGLAVSIAANRLSYTFNLTGPSLSIDTACSSFLFALHYASQAVKQGDCEAALCGGVNCIIDPRTFVSLSKAKMISPEGMSMPFTKKANGYGRGEGCGVLLLKPLKKALEDHSRIWGVINISAVNQNGRSVTPITRPSQTAQEKLLRSIYLTHVDPSVVQYVEAHGTGTPAGDSTEAENLGSIIGNNRSPTMPVLKIGSVKGNVGHAESAAGAAALIKVLLMMHHETIVPSLHYREDISSINTEKLNLSIPTTVEKWEESREFGRVAGVNCFGFGGTNAHVVVRQFKQTQVLPSFKRPIELFVLSAASGKSLKLTMEDTAEQLNISNSVTLPNLAYTSACRRSHVNYKYRKAFVNGFSLRISQRHPVVSDFGGIAICRQSIFTGVGTGEGYRRQNVVVQNEYFESTNTATTSYFTCKSIPLAVLKGDVETNRISDIPVYEAEKKMFKQNAVYIVAGGLTGLGFETVKFIAQNGGGCIAILSRSNPSSEKQEEIKALQNQSEGSRIVSLQCNVISSSQVEKAMSSIDKIFPKSPIKGVFHSAVVLHDGCLEALNLSHFEKVLSPKVAGVINLHRATRGQELDYFVCYSSVTSFLGNSTQANYAAANSFLDVFCHYRRNCGLSGQSINWGALNLGLLVNQNKIQNILESKGIDILQVHEIYEYLKKILILNNPQQAVVKLNFGTLSNHVLSRIASLKSRFRTLISEEFGSKLELSEQGTPQNLSPVNSEDYITSLVSHLSSTNVSDLTMNTSLASLGMDSMLAMTLQNRIFHDRRVEIPLVKLLDPHTTMSSLVRLLEESSNERGSLEKTTHVAESIDDGSWL
nr:highly reducing polyketide synthase PKS6-like [Chelonoidis abingdonii]